MFLSGADLREVEHLRTNLRDDGGDVHAAVVLPAVQTAFCGHGGHVDIDPGQPVPLREALQLLELVPGAAAGAVPLQRDAAVPPRRAQVHLRRDVAVMRRRAGEEDDGQPCEAIGDDGEAEEEENLALEQSPVPQEGGRSLEVLHGFVQSVRDRHTHKGTLGLQEHSHPPEMNKCLRAQPKILTRAKPMDNPKSIILPSINIANAARL